GSNDVYVVSGPDGEVLVPATSEVVQEFNPKTRQMTIYMLEGMR
ncbi:MAG TPA: 16S rRNA processing protein RimM, partial [Chloroflexi bacterium]|nr:16S rRNA processing protein RimM [Chloroflexota bacterium]